MRGMPSLSLNINFSPVNKNDYDVLDFLFIGYMNFQVFVVENVGVFTLKKSEFLEVLI
jgi:hypothetical protein